VPVDTLTDREIRRVAGGHLIIKQRQVGHRASRSPGQELLQVACSNASV
jgi:hypothetical protein